MSRMFKIAVFAVCAILAVAQLNVFAEETPKKESKTSFQKIDANGDGKITFVEFEAFYNVRCDELDANKDGNITPDELIMKVTTYSKGADTNGDGVISEDEYIAYRAGKDVKVSQEKKDAAKTAKGEKKPVFKQMDTDNDDTITLEEYAAFLVTNLDESDANGDKKQSEEELISQLKKRFKEMDADQDGMVTKDEYHTYWVGKI